MDQQTPLPPPELSEAERTQPHILARVALIFLDRCDLKGAEARRMREVQQWLWRIASEAAPENSDGG